MYDEKLSHRKCNCSRPRDEILFQAKAAGQIDRKSTGVLGEYQIEFTLNSSHEVKIVGNSIQYTERALFIRSVGRALSRDHGR